MNTDLIQELKARMPDFTNEAKLANLEVLTTKTHEREGKYKKQVFNNFPQALKEIDTKLKSKYKIAAELCKSLSGKYILVFELPASESKKVLEQALKVARNEYDKWITEQQNEWLDSELEEVLLEKAKIHTKNQEENNAKFKASLLKALQSN